MITVGKLENKLEKSSVIPPQKDNVNLFSVWFFYIYTYTYVFLKATYGDLILIP